MRISRIISVVVLALGMLPEAGAQLKLVAKEKLQSVNSPKLSKDSASLGFVTKHIVADPMTEDDAPKTFVFEFVNSGRTRLEIKRVVSTCSCAQAVCPTKALAPGEKSAVTVTYNPKGTDTPYTILINDFKPKIMGICRFKNDSNGQTLKNRR